jgi:hypothetical protein
MGAQSDRGRVSGWVEVVLRDRRGRVRRRLGGRLRNVITNVGLACMVRLVFYGLTEDRFGYLAIGTGTTAESASDTALQSEVKRKTATVTQTTTTVEGDTCLLQATFSSADGLSGTHSISEIGILNAPSGGDLLARKTITPITVNWDQGDNLTVRYYINMTR